MMRFKFTGVTDVTTTTPVLVQYTVQAILYASIRTLYSCVVRCAENMICNNGTTELNMYDTIISTLDYARNPALAWPVLIKDMTGATKYVKFLPLPKDTPRYTVIKDEKGREQERFYNLLMQEVTLS